MQIELNQTQEDFVRQPVTEGRYASESEVVRMTIRLAQARDEKLAELRARIQESMQESLQESLKDTREVSDEAMDKSIELKSQELLAESLPV